MRDEVASSGPMALCSLQSVAVVVWLVFSVRRLVGKVVRMLIRTLLSLALLTGCKFPDQGAYQAPSADPRCLTGRHVPADCQRGQDCTIPSHENVRFVWVCDEMVDAGFVERLDK